MLKAKTFGQLKFHYQHYQTILPLVKRRAQGIVRQQLNKLHCLIAEKQVEQAYR